MGGWKCRTGRQAGIVALLVVLALYGMARPLPVLAALEYNQRLDLNDDFDSCTGETIRITGTQHIVGRVTEDATGRAHFGFTRSMHGSGIGQSSSTRYILTDAIASSSIEVTSSQATTFLQQYHTNLIRQGEGVADDDLILQWLLKLTFNANGEVTASVDLLHVECR